MAVVASAERGLIVYQLENQPSEFRRIDSPLKHQVTGFTYQVTYRSP
jgi:mRNA export factor